MARTTAPAPAKNKPKTVVVEIEDLRGQHIDRVNERKRVARRRLTNSKGVFVSADTPEGSETARKYTPGELVEARRRIEYLYIHGNSTRSIQERLYKGTPAFNLTTTFIRRVVDECRAEMAKDADENREHTKNVQIKRLFRWLQIAQEQKDLGAIAKFEAQLADLQGTRDAVKVAHTVHQTKAMQIVFTNADDASLLRELHEALAEERMIQGVKAKQLEAHVVDAEIVP